MPISMNQFGQVVHDCWHDLPNHYYNIVLDAFCIMPNHVHGIVIINNELLNEGSVETGFKPVCGISSQINMERKDFVKTGLRPVSTTQKPHSLFEVIRAFKSFAARRINEKRQTAGLPVWQSRFYDHIIRNDDSLAQIRHYIIENPTLWCSDKFYVAES
jgi:putative transposase